jgi:hypothetical protein
MAPELQVASEPVPPGLGGAESAVVAGGGDEEELIRQFKREELKYQECPTHPKETRR